MASDLFSVTIFFVVFREALEATLVVSVLLSLVEQILHKGSPALPDHSNTSSATDPESSPTTVSPRVLKKLRLQVCTRRRQRHLLSMCFPGHSRCLGRLSHRSRYRWCVHRHLVHPGQKSLVELGTIMGRHALPPPRRSCADTSSNRHISVDRFRYDFRYGRDHA
jgi:high-affinity Fe2+/Pb2+ permease